MKHGRVPITVVMPVYNAQSVIQMTLDQLLKQSYPIREIIVVDNCSSDQTPDILRRYQMKYKNITFIRRSKTYGLPQSYNLGISKAKTNLVVSLHADSYLPTRYELKKLITPFEENTSIIGTHPFLVLPYQRWKQYGFWQKCNFVRDVDVMVPSGNGKFDCYKKDVYKKAGGYNEQVFSPAVGGEDIDIYKRLHKMGKIVTTNATVWHMHPIEGHFGVIAWARRRKFLSVTYGVHVRRHWNELLWKDGMFFVRPILALATSFLFIHWVFVLPLLIFPFFFMRRMYQDSTTRGDARLVALPFIVIFFVYYESFWLLYGFTKK